MGGAAGGHGRGGALAGFLLALTGCGRETMSPPAWTPPCDAPVAGRDRFSERDLGLGVVQDLGDLSPDNAGIGGVLAAEDLDADGDVDLLLGRYDAGPDLYENDGTGAMTSRGILPAAEGWTLAASASAADVDGDGLPEILVSGLGMFALYPNLGGMSFGSPEMVWRDADDPPVGVLGPTFADFDGDGALDIALIAAGHWGEEAAPAPHRILYSRDGAWVVETELEAGTSSLSLLGMASDRDRDGDPDLLVPADHAEPSRFFRNDRGRFVDDLLQVCCEIQLNAMGVDSADLNRDGTLDYCVTDLGPPRCYLSDGAGRWADAGEAIGLLEDGIGWSIDIDDLDNDGFPEILQGSAFHDETSIDLFLPDLLWWGLSDGHFEEVSADLGFGVSERHRGLTVADLDGNGALDIVRAGAGATPTVWMNQCTENAWIDVELQGDGTNPAGIGALVSVEAAGRVQLREVRGPRGTTESPTRLHFGLGATARVDRVTVDWPWGGQSEVTDVPAGTLVVVPR